MVYSEGRDETNFCIGHYPPAICDYLIEFLVPEGTKPLLQREVGSFFSGLGSDYFSSSTIKLWVNSKHQQKDKKMTMTRQE